MSIPAPTPTGSGAVDACIAIWRALAALGVRDVVLSPGSRSAPLVYALDDGLVRDRIRAHVRIDERAAAFTALGISREDPRHPAVVVTTSGTAAAHLQAAVMEAHHSRIPLLVITADRPAELRGTGANQTTRQVGMYRPFVRWESDLPAPSREEATAVELRTVVNSVARALAAARGAHPGPVHLNLGFRDPLVPAGGALPPSTDEEGIDGEDIVLTRVPAPAAPLAEVVDLAARCVVVAGDGAGRPARELAETHRLPLLAEPSSGSRAGDCLIPGYPQFLAQVMADPQHPLRPQQVIVIGHPTLSRPVVASLLGAPDVEVVVVDPAPGAEWADAARRARIVVPALEAADAHAQGREEQLSAWRRGGAETQRETQRGQGSGTDADRPWQVRAALAVWDATQEEDVLLLGSSSLVRDLEQHAGPARGRILAHRGLAGIDGTISAGTGIALSRRSAPGRVRILLGDLTALHDLTGLIIGPEEISPDLEVIVVDDGGGRIFSGLEHAEAPADLLRRFFTTPHGTDIAAASAALGVPAQTIGPGDLAAALDAPRGGGRRLLLVQDSVVP